MGGLTSWLNTCVKILHKFWEDELKKELGIRNKLVALHLRWQYKGKEHEISIEMIATVIIPAKEKKEDYEDDLKKAMRNKLYSGIGDFEGLERLEGELKEEVLGFEETETDEKVTEITVEDYNWKHAIVEEQLTLEDYIIEEKKELTEEEIKKKKAQLKEVV